MNLHEVARMSSQLVNERRDFMILRDKYNRLFNNSIPIPGSYTAYQVFLQQRAQYYACHVFRIEAAIEKFINIADSE